MLVPLTSFANDIDVLRGLVDKEVVEGNLKTNMNISFGDGMGEKVEMIDRIGLSNLFLVNIDGKPYVSDGTGGFISSQADFKRFTNSGLFNALATNQDTEDNIKFYEYAKTQKDNLPVFPGVGDNKGLIVAFMDPSCPNCKKFHLGQRVAVNSLGFDVMYVPSARNPMDDKLINSLVHFYCRSNDLLPSIQQLYNDYSKVKSLQKPLESCTGQHESYIRSISEVFSRHRMIGSPAFITPDGMTLYGYGELERYTKKKAG